MQTYMMLLHVSNATLNYMFVAAEQAEIQKTIDELRTEVDKRDAEIKHLQKNLKEAETILVRSAPSEILNSQFLYVYNKYRLEAKHIVTFQINQIT